MTDWLTVVMRGQHEDQRVRIGSYAPLGLIEGRPRGTAYVSASRSEQRGKADALDGFARVNLTTGPITHLLVAGLTHTWNTLEAFSASGSQGGFINLLNPVDVPPLPVIDTLDYTIDSTRFGQYGQYILGIWKLKLIGGLRRNETKSSIFFSSGNRLNNTQRATATTPSYGVVFDVTNHFSVFGNLVYGYDPIFTLDFEQRRLPDIRTRNMEGGIKLDLFGQRAIINASYFELRQSNLLVADPLHPGFSRAVPGQEGKGIDLNVSGQIVPGLTVQASFTRTKYSYLTASDFGDVLVAQPRDQYSVYASYTRKLSETARAGLGGGLFGRSSAAADSFGDYYVPAARQVDLNAFLTVGPLDVNLGVRNVFDRLNYGTTYASSYIPYQEPRNWRLTIGYRFR